MLRLCIQNQSFVSQIIQPLYRTRVPIPRPSGIANKNMKRNLPSWMSSRDNEGKSHGKTIDGNDENEGANENGKPKQAKARGKSNTSSFPYETEDRKSSAASLSGPSEFSKLMVEGVIFVLSGFVNPERGILRSQAMEMGAQYKPDWDSDCTLLICAFPNTPKFRQVEADCGTIVSKEWISECYSQKKLVDIETYLMHAGKPWRRSNCSPETREGSKETSPKSSQKKVESGSLPKLTASMTPNVKSKAKASDSAKEIFSPTKVKKWAIDDMKRTISWLESQEEKPEPSEIKNVAAEGILTCIQDAVDSLEQKQGVQKIVEQWSSIPRVVEELARLEKSKNGSASLSNEGLCKKAKAGKRIYETELRKLNDVSEVNTKKQRTSGSEKSENGRSRVTSSDAAGYDSDETIEMTEEEIDLAYNNVASAICKSQVI